MNKKGAMEMSVGTIVTIVLLMTVLILGLVLIRGIFKGQIDNIGAIDQSVKNEINKLFSEDSSRKMVIYPATRDIAVKKGEAGGFGFSIRNLLSSDGSFSYEVTFSESSCGITKEEAEELIILGSSGQNINLGSGNVLEDPILVKFEIPENLPLCKIRYNLDVREKSEGIYGNTISVDLTVNPQ